MLETVYAQLRLAVSILSGRPFHVPSLHRLFDSLLESQHEFGDLTREASELISGPSLDDDTRRDLQLRRFRTQADCGARETINYASIFSQLGLKPKQLSYDDICRLPLTTKTTVRDQGAGFIRNTQYPTLRTMTTGTTGKGTSVFFTQREMDIFITLAAFNLLFQGHIVAEDQVQVSTSSRALLGNNIFMSACQRVGALVYQTGIIDPAQALSLLAERRTVLRKKPQASVLMTYPSYLGRLIETGKRLGYTSHDFGLEHIILGGEITTRGVKRRSQALFGEVKFSEGYGITETWPFGGTLCERGHLHFEPSHGLMEVIHPDTGQPTQPGEIGSLVLTPFAPYRESVVLLRYDTQDMVRTLDGGCTCALRDLPATSHLLGKRQFSIRHADRWTCPRHVLEVLEDNDDIPLPARCSYWAEADGVAVEVAVPYATPELRSHISKRLVDEGVPLESLHLVTDSRQFKRALPRRGDLYEASFSAANHQFSGRRS